MVTICTTHAAYHELFGTTPMFTVPYDPADAPAIGAISVKRVRATSIFDGWGYLSLFRREAGKVERIDSYAIPEALDPAFAFGFGTSRSTRSRRIPARTSPTARTTRAVCACSGPAKPESRKSVTTSTRTATTSGASRPSSQATLLPAGWKGKRLFAGSDRDHGIFIFDYTGD